MANFKLKKQEPLEKEIQSVILDYLKMKGIFCWKEHSGGIPIQQGNSFRMMPIGLSGKADILGIMKDGRFLAIEVKRPSGVLTDAQVEFLFNIKKNGGIALVARSLDDIINANI